MLIWMLTLKYSSVNLSPYPFLGPWCPWQCFIKTLLNGRSRFGLSVADIYNDLLELQPAIIHRIVFHWLRLSSHVKCCFLIPESVSDHLFRPIAGKTRKRGRHVCAIFQACFANFFASGHKYCFFCILL